MKGNNPESNTEERLRRLLLSNQQLKAELSDFTYAVSHDINAPVRGILNLSTWILEAVQENDTASLPSYLGLLKEKSLLLKSRMDALVRLSKLSEKDTTPVEFDPIQVIRHIIASVPLSHSVQLNEPEAQIKIVGSQALFTEAIDQLLSNALNYGDAVQPEVRICIRPNNDFIDFAFRNNGNPIPPDCREIIFKPFQSLHTERQTGGMGLSIVKKITEIVAGNICIADTREGEMEFILSWPQKAVDTPI